MKRARVVIIIVAAVAAAAGLAWFFLRPRPKVDGLAASGTVEATEASLGFQIAGTLAQVRAHEGDRVRRGDTLAVLDRTELNARRAQADAQLAAARAQLAELVRGSRPEELAQAEEADSASAARLADADRDLSRTRRLVRDGAVSQETLDKAAVAAAVTRSAREQAAQQLRLSREGPRRERIDAQRAMVAQSEAVIRQVTAQLANAVVVAPFDAVVTVRHREPGEIVGPGAPVVTIANLGDRWVRIYVAEDRLGSVGLGEPATITTDTFAHRQFAGGVSFIASEAEFTPKNVQTTEERVKLVYAVKVRITGDSANVLKPGMPADVRLQPAK